MIKSHYYFHDESINVLQNPFNRYCFGMETGAFGLSSPCLAGLLIFKNFNFTVVLYISYNVQRQ